MRRAAILLTLLPLISVASVPASLTLEELFHESDVVVLVEVIEGRRLNVGDDHCGAAYTGEVLNSLKGTADGEIIFGYYVGTGIGNKYLLFLTTEEYNPMTSTNSMQTERHNECQEQCVRLWPHYLVAHSGYGSLEVKQAGALDFVEGIGIPSNAIRIPTAIPAVRENEIHWVNLADVLEYLDGLDDMAPN